VVTPVSVSDIYASMGGRNPQRKRRHNPKSNPNPNWRPEPPEEEEEEKVDGDEKDTRNADEKSAVKGGAKKKSKSASNALNTAADQGIQAPGRYTTGAQSKKTTTEVNWKPHGGGLRGLLGPILEEQHPWVGHLSEKTEKKVNFLTFMLSSMRIS